jgi:NADH-quinone oxidoreductase subunit M
VWIGLAAPLGIPAAVIASSWIVRDVERLRALALSAGCLLLAISSYSAATLAPISPTAHGLLRLDALAALLVPFAALLWVLAVGVAPRANLDRAGIRRTALATWIHVATFLSASPALLVLLWIASVAVLLRGLAAGGSPRALRLAATYLGASCLLLTAGVALLGAAAGDGRLTTAGSALVLFAVMIRKGIVPLHGWLPEVFEHGRLGPAVLFSAPQVGAYVAIVLVLPRAPQALLSVTGLLALATAVYGAVAAVAQADARRAFGFLFASQSALVMAGLECVSVEGLSGGLCLWLSSGVAFAALARCLAVLEARRGRLSLDRFNGGYERMPLLAASFLLAALAAIGFPGTFGFVGHELLVSGTVARYPRTGFLVVLAAAFGGIALMRAYLSLFCGRRDPQVHLRLTRRELIIFACVAGLLIATGLAPRPIVASRAAAASRILAERGEAAAAP